MKRSEMVWRLAENMRKHENIFKGYKKGSIGLRCATDNLATYLVKVIESELFEWEPEEFEDEEE